MEILYLTSHISACPEKKGRRISGMVIALMLLEPSAGDEKVFVHQKGRRLVKMRYGIAWLLGVPVSVLVVWFLVTHLL